MYDPKKDKVKVEIEPVEGSWNRALNLARRTAGRRRCTSIHPWGGRRKSSSRSTPLSVPWNTSCILNKSVNG